MSKYMNGVKWVKTINYTWPTVNHQHGFLVGGWAYPSEKYESQEFISWDDDIPNWMESHKIPWFQTTNQIWNGYIS